MSKKFGEEEFQEFVVEQFGKLATGLSDVRSEIVEVRIHILEGLRDIRVDIAGIEKTLEPLAKAFDVEAEKNFVLGVRIDHIEEHLGFPKYVERTEKD
jgi:hypothetical protein